MVFKEFFFQINFILKLTFSSSNDLISVTYRHTYRKWLLNILSDVKIGVNLKVFLERIYPTPLTT